jgi:hypothetical protein
VVELLSPEEEDINTEKYSKQNLKNLSVSNVLNNSSWQHTDVIVSEHNALLNVIKIKKLSAPYDINPRIVVFDEIDYLLRSGQEKKFMSILRKFASPVSQFADENLKRQLIFSGSTISLKT